MSGGAPVGYRGEDRARFAPESLKPSERSPFARDRARVLHCAALRRLAAKTQVLVAGESDIPRTRLTHTLEVAQVAREMGAMLGADPDLVEVAALAHDIGHPPFGHNGEDAVVLEHLDLGALATDAGRDAVLIVAQQQYAANLSAMELDEALTRLMALPQWPRDFTGSHSDLRGLKALTSVLIGRFSQAAQAATTDRFGDQPLRRYEAELLVPLDSRAEVAVMKAVAAHFVMQRPGALEIYEQQRRIIQDLVAAIVLRGRTALDPWLAEEWDRADDDAARLRVVIDQVASLTDTSVLRWHRQLCG